VCLYVVQRKYTVEKILIRKWFINWCKNEIFKFLYISEKNDSSTLWDRYNIWRGNNYINIIIWKIFKKKS